MDLAIETDCISKVYHPPDGWRRRTKKVPVTAVDCVSLSVPQGELFGLLGPNGAGKTTLVKMLCTLILPSSGTATVAGADLRDERRIRAAVGLVVSDERSFFWRLSVQRNLEFFAAMYGLSKIDASARIQAVLKDVDLLDRAGQRFSNLSSGMRQRLAIARALLHQPKILFLDEPTRSLDPIATGQLHDLILHVRAERQMTVFLITHNLAEAEKLCNRVALMHEAQIRTIGQPTELRRHLYPQRTYTISAGPIGDSEFHGLRELIPTLDQSEQSKIEQVHELRFKADDRNGELTTVIDYLRQHDVKILAIESTPPSLEDVFAHYTSGSTID